MRDFWAIDDNGMYWYIREGTGDNLSQVDIDNGYVDYIYYDYYEDLQDIYDDNSYDGGMILLKTLYADMSLEDVVERVEDFENVKLTIQSKSKDNMGN